MALKPLGKATGWPPLGWRITRLRKKLTELSEKYEPLIDAAPDNDARVKLEGDWQGDSWEFYEELDNLVTQRAVRRARWWHVSLPEKNRLPIADGTEERNWELTPTFGYKVLTLRSRLKLEEDLWRRQLEFFALLIGVCSIVQTVFTVLSYYRR